MLECISPIVLPVPLPRNQPCRRSADALDRSIEFPHPSVFHCSTTFGMLAYDLGEDRLRTDRLEVLDESFAIGAVVSESSEWVGSISHLFNSLLQNGGVRVYERIVN